MPVNPLLCKLSWEAFMGSNCWGFVSHLRPPDRLSEHAFSKDAGDPSVIVTFLRQLVTIAAAFYMLMLMVCIAYRFPRPF